MDLFFPAGFVKTYIANVWCVCACSVMSDSNSRTEVREAPLSMGLPSQDYWSGLLLPSPEDLPDPKIELASLMSPVMAESFFTTSVSWEAQVLLRHLLFTRHSSRY